jgi:hypothetical protein
MPTVSAPIPFLDIVANLPCHTLKHTQALLGDTTFMAQLQQYDKDNIPAAYITAVRPYLERPELAPDSVKKASKAAYGLCCWVRAMEAYDRWANGCCRHGVHLDVGCTASWACMCNAAYGLCC